MNYELGERNGDSFSDKNNDDIYGGCSTLVSAKILLLLVVMNVVYDAGVFIAQIFVELRGRFVPDSRIELRC